VHLTGIIDNCIKSYRGISQALFSCPGAGIGKVRGINLTSQ
jgi:hypothetical protein